jgi:hypothetical protein
MASAIPIFFILSTPEDYWPNAAKAASNMALT